MKKILNKHCSNGNFYSPFEIIMIAEINEDLKNVKK